MAPPRTTRTGRCVQLDLVASDVALQGSGHGRLARGDDCLRPRLPVDITPSALRPNGHDIAGCDPGARPQACPNPSRCTARVGQSQGARSTGGRAVPERAFPYRWPVAVTIHARVY